jgi:hypothetical protein
MKTKVPARQKCRRTYCPNYYDDVVGQKGWTQHASLKGAECIPCMFSDLLAKTGWTWQHVKDSYQRVMALPPDIRERELSL